MLAPMTHDPSSQSKAQPTRKLEYGPNSSNPCSVTTHGNKPDERYSQYATSLAAADRLLSSEASTAVRPWMRSLIISGNRSELRKLGLICS